MISCHWLNQRNGQLSFWLKGGEWENMCEGKKGIIKTSFPLSSSHITENENEGNSVSFLFFLWLHDNDNGHHAHHNMYGSTLSKKEKRSIVDVHTSCVFFSSSSSHFSLHVSSWGMNWTKISVDGWMDVDGSDTIGLVVCLVKRVPWWDMLWDNIAVAHSHNVNSVLSQLKS